jgi:hypothetical protein
MSEPDKSDKKRLAKITEEEKSLMQKWLQKEHIGHNQLNARWIKGGGGHGSGMTESKAVKTSGAYEALAKYVNEKLQSKPKEGDDNFWTAKIACNRFTAAFKAYSEASKLGDISDSAVGASEEQIRAQADYNAALLSQKVKKCPMYLVFSALYAEHPSIHPVVNVGMGTGQIRQGDIDDEIAAEGASEEGAARESKEEQSSKASKETKKADGFKLKEGAKKVDFTTAWATTMGQAKQARLEFEKKREKREREERRKDRAVQDKKIKSDLLASLLARNCTDDQIKAYMRLAGHYVDDAQNFS